MRARVVHDRIMANKPEEPINTTPIESQSCSHCRNGFAAGFNVHVAVSASRDQSATPEHALLAWTWCTNPGCSRLIVGISRSGAVFSPLRPSLTILYPTTTPREPLGPGLPTSYRDDVDEAAKVLPISPKACAALSRRCLQKLLRDKGGVKPGDLSAEIDEVLPKLPEDLATQVDAIRHFGNFAAHPNKSTATGEIIDVEPDEAEWTLDVLESMLNFYFVEPEARKARLGKLDAKLKEFTPNAKIKGPKP